VDAGGEGEARSLWVGRHTCAEYRSGACRRQRRRSRPCACSLANGIACSSDDTLLVQGLGFRVYLLLQMTHSRFRVSGLAFASDGTLRCFNLVPHFSIAYRNHASHLPSNLNPKP
jgi:hypothetical protein